jgi:type IV pilus assembly protein PilB
LSLKERSSLKKTVKDLPKTEYREKIGELLLRKGQITKGQLDHALDFQRKNGGRLGSILVRLGYIDEKTICNVLSHQFNYPAIKIDDYQIKPELLDLVPYEFAKAHLLFPVKLENKVLLVAMMDPTDISGIDELQRKTRLSIKTAVALERDIIEAYRKYYKISEEEYQSFFRGKEEQEEIPSINEIEDIGLLVSEAVEGITLDDETGPERDEEHYKYSAEDAPIIKLVDQIFLKAIKEGISDIHIEPFENAYYVRYRLDGALYKAINLPLEIKNALTSRIKIMSNLNIAERRVPQDGRIKMKLGSKKIINFRVSTLPTIFGESIVLRLLDKSSFSVDLTRLGFTDSGLEKFKRAIQRPYGMILVTGPTGSGKTTTLYSALNVLNTIDKKILTVEDPVEYTLKGVNQVQVKEEAGLTFAAALRAFLRQDPDIIMVGEIRDQETAEIAIRAAMTGHLVLSTVHTNDCPSTIGRLIDMGIPPYLVASTVTLVLSQRLLRRICDKCRTPLNNIRKEILDEAGFPLEERENLSLYYGQGCPECARTGYRGRIAVYEILELSENIRQAITARVPEDQLRRIALKEGMTTLRQEALQKAREGVTTIDEVLQKTVADRDSLPSYILNPDEHVYEDGELVFKEGNTDNNFYKLIRGCLIVSKNGKEIGEITEPGRFFGEASALLKQPRSVTVRSKGRSTVKIFPGEKLKETLENYPEIASQIVNSLVSELEEKYIKAANLTVLN